MSVIPDRRPVQQPTGTGSQNSVSQSATNSGSPTEDLADGLVRVTCPKCQYPLRCKTELLGTKGQCKQCKCIFTIGDTKVVAEDVTALIFSCPKCDQLFDGKPEMEGRKGKCHACGEVFHIKLRAAESSPPEPAMKVDSEPSLRVTSHTAETKTASTPVSSSNQSKSNKAPSKPVEPASAKLQVICGGCQGMMQVPPSASGKKVTCPHCSQLLQVPGGSSQSTGTSIFDQTDEVLGVLETNAAASSNPFSFGPTPSNSYPANNSTGNGYPPPMPYVPVAQYSPAATPYAGPTAYTAPDPYTPTTSAYQYLSAAENELVQEKSLARDRSSHNLIVARVILFSLAALHFLLMGFAVFALNVRLDRYMERHPGLSREEVVLGSYIALGVTSFVCLAFIFFAFLIRTLPLLCSIAPMLLFVGLAILWNFGELNWFRLTIDFMTVCALLKVLIDGINYRH
ncbi:MAG: hypothetical protein U0930_14415 [Pirellulales bacterium]